MVNINGYYMVNGGYLYIYIMIYTGWWYTFPSEKYEFVSWDDDYSQYVGK